MTIAGFDQLPFRFGGLGVAPTVAHSDIVVSSLAGAGVATTAARSDAFTASLAGAGVALTGARSDILSASGVRYKIAEIAAGGLASATFASIPQTFKHLEVVWDARDTTVATAVNLNMRLNGDSGSNYYYEFNQATAATPSSNEGLAASSGFVGVVSSASAPANVSASGVIRFPNYTGAVFAKTWTAECIFATSNSSGGTILDSMGGRWMATVAPVTQIALFPTTLFVTGSVFTLFGEGF